MMTWFYGQSEDFQRFKKFFDLVKEDSNVKGSTLASVKQSTLAASLGGLLADELFDIFQALKRGTCAPRVPRWVLTPPRSQL